MSATITKGVFAGMTREALTTTRAKLQQALLDLAMGEKTVSVGYAAGGLSSRTATFTAADEARMSARETAIAVLHSRLVASLAVRNPAPVVLRGEAIPQRIPAGGLVVIRDGETLEETPILSPLAWQIEHRAEVEITVAGATPAARNTLLDALLMDVAAAITANRTLGGAVEWAQPGSASFEDVEFEGAAAARAAAIPVTLWFTVAGSPLA